MLRNAKIVLSLALLGSACMQGNLSLIKSDCPSGKVRQGSFCMDDTSAATDKASKLAMTNCVDPDLAKVSAGVTITLCNGSTGVGTLLTCTGDGQSNCVVAGDIKSADTTKFDATKIVSGATIAGVTGAVSVPTACTADGQQNCTTSGNFKALNSTSLTSSNIAKGVSIAGVTGTKPDIKSCRNAANLSYFDTQQPFKQTISYISGVATPNITLAWNHTLNVNDQVMVTCSGGSVPNGTVLNGTVTAGTPYYIAAVGANTIQLKATLGGAALAVAAGGTCNGYQIVSPISDGIASGFDTIDDYNGYAATLTAPATSPWSTNYVCNEADFVNVSGGANLVPSNTTPTSANQTWTQIWQDQLTGLYLTNILYNGGGTTDWYASYTLCSGLDTLSTGGTGWRLPTQKELMQLYIDGISKVSLAGGSTSSYFWSASAVSYSTNDAWVVYLAYGYSNYYNRASAGGSVVCVR